MSPIFTRPHIVAGRHAGNIASVFCLAFMSLQLLVAGAFAGEGGYYEPGLGTSERKDIMDAARGPISREIGTRVIFAVSVLRSDGRFAYLQATPVNSDSTPIDWYKTKFAEDWNEDMMSDVVMVLLERRDGNWVVKDYVIGPTDVFWFNWVDQYDLPEKLFYGG